MSPFAKDSEIGEIRPIPAGSQPAEESKQGELDLDSDEPVTGGEVCDPGRPAGCDSCQ